ncbi:MAG: AMP-binding protein [Micromonosporaceae bacterium]|nr:AMP-binding protein [Micromonosporaceae bacterium]
MPPDQQPPDLPNHRAETAGALLGTRHDFPQRQTVLDLFAERVRQAPERPAVRHRDATLSYADLDQAANQVAGRLIALAAPRAALIPLLITDGPEFPAGLLGILKAGAAFVPLDPAWPSERLRAIATRPPRWRWRPPSTRRPKWASPREPSRSTSATTPASRPTPTAAQRRRT